MELATTFLSSPCSIRSLGWAPGGRINGACAPSFVSVKASVTNNKKSMVEILQNLNMPDKISNPWQDAYKNLNVLSPGWCGEVRDVKYSDNGRVTVVYRVTIFGSDGQAHREGIGTVALNDNKDPEAEAEEIAFAKACARFGWGNLHRCNEKNIG